MGELANDKFPKERFGLITGSECSVLVPIKSAEVGQRTYAKKLANEKYFRFYDEFSNKHTDHGEYGELFAFEYFKKNHCSEAEKPEFKTDGVFGGSADCICPDYGVDFKCPTSLGKWLDYLHTGIDKDQYDQCQLYMKVFNRDRWFIAAFLIETLWMNDFGMKYPVPEDKRMILVEVKADLEWRVKLETNAPLVITMRDFYFAKLVQQFGPPIV